MDFPGQQAEQIFAEALQIPDAVSRRKYLAEACAGNEALRQEVESLLQAREQAGEFLVQTVKLATSDFTIERTGTMIGRYKLLEKIGEGGFGSVYMAEQIEPLQRKVALKIIKAGMDTREVVARFEAERQALALMDHPNIARVLDAGATEAGRPYFVMELVRGIPITGYCDQKNLSTAERLQLFIQVCHAVQHAHQKGIIHRDLKPNNVLVTLHDGGPVPKVIDFGVAKALGPKLTEKTLFTGFAHMIGTPAYMSPEQAELSGLDIDTRSDIYSLGVLLYELLTGVTPLDAETWRKAALDEIRRMIRETEPSKPSTRLQTLGAKLNDIAKVRHTEPNVLKRLVRGDLDWIVMKALEKDRRRRYETPDAFASDVARHLSNEPVLASSPSVPYLVGKFARRHKTGLVVTATLLLLLLAGATVSTWQAVRAVRAEKIAVEKASLAVNEQRRADRTAQELRQNLYASDLNVVSEAWHSGNVGLMRQLLNAHRPKPGEPDVRGFEWFYYWKLSEGEQKELIPLDLREATDAVISADGSLVAYVRANELRIFNWATRQTVVTLPNWNNTAFALSPDNRLIAKASSDGLHLIEINTLREKVLPTGEGRNVLFCPTGRLIAVFRPSSIDLWDYEAGIKLRTLPCDEKVRTFRRDWSADGKRLFAVEDFVRVAVWDVDAGTKETIDTATSESIGNLSSPSIVIGIAPDGRALIVVNFRGEMSAIEIPSRRVLASCKGFPQGQAFVKFSSDGQWMAAFGPDNHIVIWDTTKWVQIAALRGHEDFVIGIGFFRQTRKLISAGSDDTIRVWEFGQASERTAGTSSVVDWGGRSAIQFSFDSRYLALATSGSATNPAGVLWNLVTRELKPINGWPVAFSPNGAQLLLDCASGGLQISDVESGEVAKKLELESRAHLLSALSPNGKFLACISYEGLETYEGRTSYGIPLRLRVYDPSRAEVWSRLHSVLSLAFSPNSRWLAMSKSQGIHDEYSTLLLKQLNGPDERTVSNCAAACIAFSPDGQLLAAGTFPPGVNLVDVETTTVLAKLKGHQTMVTAVAFSPDGRTLASGAQDRTIRLYHLATRRQLAVLPVSGTVVGLAFSPDGHLLVSRELASGNEPGRYRFWFAPREDVPSLPAPAPQAPEPGSFWLPDSKQAAREQQ